MKSSYSVLCVFVLLRLFVALGTFMYIHLIIAELVKGW